MKAKWYITIFMWVLGWCTMAQNTALSFINFSEKDGLTDKYIYTVAQDKNHMIWIGTGSGLYRFDGKKFERIKSSIDKPGRQIGNILQNIYVDRSGKLWLSSINALQIFDPTTQVFSSLNYNDPLINKMIKGFIMGFHEDKKGNIWIATQTDYWYKYNPKTKKVIHFVPRNSNVTEASKDVLKIIETPDGHLWAVTTNGLFEFFDNGTIIPHWNSKKGNSFYDGFYDAKRNCIWLAGGFEGIVQFDIQSKHFESQPLIVSNSKNSNPANFVTLIAPKDDNSLWFSASILGEYSISTKKFVNHSPVYKDEYSFKTTPISRFFHDREHNLWIASYSGLSMLPWQNNQVQSYPLFNSFAEYTVEPYGSLLYKGGYLIANNTSNGLLWFQPKENKMELIQNPFYSGQFRNMKGIEALAITADKQIYGASADGIFLLNQTTNQLIPMNVVDQNGKKPNAVFKIFADRSHTLYMTSATDGYYTFNTKTNSLRHIKLAEVDPTKKTASSGMISPRIEDQNGNIWFTYTNGVYCLDKKTMKYLHYAYGKAKNNGATISQSIDVIQDSKGHYWITTLDNGIFELILKDNKETLINYSKENSGLPADYCANIVTDGNGMIWIGTSNGLVQFDPIKKQIVSIMGQQHGLKDNGTSVVVNRLTDGSIVVNHYGQLSVFNPKTYKKNTLQPKVTFSTIKVLDHNLSTKEINAGNIDLKYNENFITIDWASNVYNNSNQNRFAYQLSGVDKEWNYTEKNSISYSNLEDGDYVFKVKSANNDGVWGEVTTFQISIATPFWKAWWFYGLLVLLVGGILYALYQFKLSQVKKEESLKSVYAQQIAEIEMKALRAQMNPHFIFNSLNSIQKYILKNDSFAASQYLTKFSKLIRLILDHSNQNYILLSSEAELLKLYIEIEALRFDNQFEYELVVDDSLNTETIQIPSMIIQPYVENAIWHGLLHKETKGKLTLHITRFDENNIKVLVTDDGIGRQKAQELKSKQVLKKKSYGLQITEDRISILNKTQSNKTTLKIHDLKDENGNASGTQIELIIPVQTLNE
ncbi:MAG: histidine kinase [Flavobacteriales bacterium]|nr:histidine kinase [Flavobacteriales bacterium]